MVNHPNRNKRKRNLTLGLNVFTGDAGQGTAKYSAAAWTLIGNWESGVTKKLPDSILNKPGKATVIVYDDDIDLAHLDESITAKDHRKIVDKKVKELRSSGWKIKIVKFHRENYLNWLNSGTDDQESRSQWASEQ